MMAFEAYLETGQKNMKIKIIKEKEVLPIEDRRKEEMLEIKEDLDIIESSGLNQAKNASQINWIISFVVAIVIFTVVPIIPIVVAFFVGALCKLLASSTEKILLKKKAV